MKFASKKMAVGLLLLSMTGVAVAGCDTGTQSANPTNTAIVNTEPSASTPAGGDLNAPGAVPTKQGQTSGVDTSIQAPIGEPTKALPIGTPVEEVYITPVASPSVTP